jgi:hypothetical protein
MAAPLEKDSGLEWQSSGKTKRVVRWNEADYPDVYWNCGGDIMPLIWLDPQYWPDLYNPEVYKTIPVFSYQA